MKKISVGLALLISVFAVRQTSATPPGLFEIYAGTYLYGLYHGVDLASGGGGDDDEYDGEDDDYGDDSGSYDDDGDDFDGFDDQDTYAVRSYSSAMSQGQSAEKLGDSLVKDEKFEAAFQAYQVAYDAFVEAKEAASKSGSQQNYLAAREGQSRVMLKQDLLNDR